eukprot:TRINITY_DN23625_c0_g2_i4.p1 TRINITY_DN23625_c0_g2~~TRINITY_DN23625_c0_g2_i4.p1  ORF type:complete len:1101 (-),score=235.44 TRINITY_DN23625_c0_g2_i4:85-3351(-)
MPFQSARQLIQERQAQGQQAPEKAETQASTGRGRGRAAGRGRQSILCFAPAADSVAAAAASVGSEKKAATSTDIVDLEEGSPAATKVELRSLLVGRQFHRLGNQQLIERSEAAAEGSLDLRVTLSVEREPRNQYDPLALLVRTSQGEPCGHLPKEHATLLSPLIDERAVLVSSATASSKQVIELSNGGFRALPLLLCLDFCCAPGSKDMANARVKLQELASSVATIARPLKRKAESSSQSRGPQQRSLLTNFGRGLGMEALSSSSGVFGARVLLTPSFLPELAKHLGIAALLAMQRVCRDLRCSVETLRHTRCRKAVERLVSSRLGDSAAATAAAEALAALGDSGACGQAQAHDLTGALQAVAAWVPSTLGFETVKQALSKLEAMPPWQLLERVARGSGWLALAAAIWTASSTGRMRVIQAALACTPLDELREMVALLVLISASHSWHSREQGEASGARQSIGLQRLHRDLLACNRLLEEAGPKVTVVGLRMPGVHLTEEQSQIVVKSLAPTEMLLISAFAGTGKTSTLRMYALLRPHLQILYLCFNVSVREEAQRVFPKNVTCRSVHQLAYAACGYRFRQKLAADELRAEDIMSLGVFSRLADARGRKRGSSDEDAMRHLEGVEACLATLKGFLNSADTCLTAKHLPHPAPGPLRDGNISEETVCDLAKELWRKMCEPDDGEVKMTHGGYLKLYSLSRPQLKCDLVMLDEAQDCNPAIACVVTSQSCARILVGDEHQAIYGFLGAQDMLKEQRLKSQEKSGLIIRRQLTRSFRFGQNVADLSNYLLRSFTAEARPLLGCGKQEGQLLEPSGDTNDINGWPSPPFTYIARTNTKVLMQALCADEAGLSLEWVGGVKGYKLGLLRDLCNLALGKRECVESGRIKAFSSLNAVQIFAKRVEDRELAQRTDLVLRSNPDELLKRLQRLEAIAERREKAQSAAKADVCLSTVHKAKGLEWDTVVVAEDFLDAGEEAQRLAQMGCDQPGVVGDVQELNMLYVALTRCKCRLQLPLSLARLYMPQAEAVTLATPSQGGSSCFACGQPLEDQARVPSRRSGPGSQQPCPVGSVSLRALCRSCARQSVIGTLEAEP